MDYTNHSVVYKNHDMIYTDHVSDGNAGTRTYCSTYRSSNGCPLAFTYQSADNGTCCCTGATADYSTFGLVVHCAATAQQQCAAQK